MHRFLWLLALLPSLNAGVISGVVVDHYSGRPIQRALVMLRPVAGAASGQVATRTARSGQFVFSPVPTGAYLITVSRAGFVNLHYGQKAPNAPARPLFLAEDGAPFLEMRLHRLGAISGMVLDENDIGYPNVDVFVYKPSRPPVLMGQSKTDERGNFRIGSLQRGRYLVRSGPAQLEDGVGILPTFHRESATVAEARLVDVEYDQQAMEVAVRPSYGRLVRIRGQAHHPTNPPQPVTITLSSDMGRKTTTADGSGFFGFEALAPGQYELKASSFVLEPGGRLVPAGTFTSLLVERDVDVKLEIKAYRDINLRVEDVEGKRNLSRTVVVQARTKDLAGEGEAQTLRPGSVLLAPGRWEFLAVTPPEMYQVSIGDWFPRTKRVTTPAVWTEVLIAPGAYQEIQVRVSSRPATLSGRVMAGVGKPAIGAPVFLEPLDAEGRLRITIPRVAIAGMEGEYRFAGLPPGRYRLLSTFEFLEPEEEDILNARPKLVTLSEGAEASEDLELWVRP